ncbi:MAG: hypothetical protein QOF72_1683 [Blastocatellia bacterium]|jgi:hypothetical protein|nr:hypothetical protein [Blastocatellia bacterium]
MILGITQQKCARREAGARFLLADVSQNLWR